MKGWTRFFNKAKFKMQNIITNFGNAKAKNKKIVCS